MSQVSEMLVSWSDTLSFLDEVVKAEERELTADSGHLLSHLNPSFQPSGRCAT